jgi:putative DNA primase/helicase
MKTDVIEAPESSSLSMPAVPVEDHLPGSNGAALLDELAGTLNRFAVLPQWGAETLALWILHTYAFELREFTAYLGIESPEKRCGKSTVLGVLRKLVKRPVVAANISPSAFFRVIADLRPTLLIDEADTFLQGNDELRGILNAGYSRETAFVWRVSPNADLSPEMLCPDEQPVTNREGSVTKYTCWCPKVMAAIGRLPDTLADRCIVLRMQRKSLREKCARLRDLDGKCLQRACEQFVKTHRDAIRDARPEPPADLNDRAADIWESMFALADLAGGDWPGKARAAAIGLTAGAQEACPIATLLLDIMAVFVVQKVERIFTRNLIKELSELGPRPWQEAASPRPSGKGNGNGSRFTDAWLARQLRPYGIRSTTLRVNGELAKGYLKAEIIHVIGRYISKAEARAMVGLPEKANEDPPNP